MNSCIHISIFIIEIINFFYNYGNGSTFLWMSFQGKKCNILGKSDNNFPFFPINVKNNFNYPFNHYAAEERDKVEYVFKKNRTFGTLQISP